MNGDDMAKADRDALPEHTADLVDLLHERLTSESDFARLAINYDYFEPRRWYASLLSEIAILVGDEALEYVDVIVAPPSSEGGLWLSRITVLTASLVITSSGDIAEESSSADHPPVQAFSRSTLESLEVSASRANPFDGRSWPGWVHALAKYRGRALSVTFRVQGADSAQALLDSLRRDLA